MKLQTIPVPAPVRRRIAVCADFHSIARPMPVEDALRLLREAQPDLILFPGDIFSDLRYSSVRDSFNRNGLDLMERAVHIAPCFFSTGNHEMGLSEENHATLEAIGVNLPADGLIRMGEMVLGALPSPYLEPRFRYRTAPQPDTEPVDRLSAEEGYRILLCHHPEYWERFIVGRGIHLTVAGHAHGGQWRVFGQGIYAPGQGFFPRYTKGLYREGEETLAVTPGMTNSVKGVPRLFNPCEILLLDLCPEAVT